MTVDGMSGPNTYLRAAVVLSSMAETELKGRTPEEIAEITGGDPEPIRQAYSAVRIIRKDEDED